MPLYISIDLDQTILDDDGHMIAGAREALAKLHANGSYDLQLWSKGGAARAREKAKLFRLSQYFKSYASKPDVAIDDLPEDAAPICRLGVPLVAAAKVIDDFVAAGVDSCLVPSRKVIELVAGIQAEQGEMERLYRGSILRDGVPLHPVPFFGNLDNAAIVTIGLNPSSTEFEPWRGWPDVPMESEDLARRLAGYFRNVNPRPHAWFGDYQEALGIISGDYKINAAHLDLLPWPTLSPTWMKMQANKSMLFRKYNAALKAGRARWLTRLMESCSKKVKLVAVFDSFSARGAETKAMCRSVLPNAVCIESFKDTRMFQRWCWENRDHLRQRLGSGVFLG